MNGEDCVGKCVFLKQFLEFDRKNDCSITGTYDRIVFSLEKGNGFYERDVNKRETW